MAGPQPGSSLLTQVDCASSRDFCCFTLTRSGAVQQALPFNRTVYCAWSQEELAQSQPWEHNTSKRSNFECREAGDRGNGRALTGSEDYFQPICAQLDTSTASKTHQAPACALQRFSKSSTTGNLVANHLSNQSADWTSCRIQLRRAARSSGDWHRAQTANRMASRSGGHVAHKRVEHRHGNSKSTVSLQLQCRAELPL